MRRRPLLCVPLLAVALTTGVLAAPATAAPPSMHGGDFRVMSFEVTGGTSPGPHDKVNLFTAVSSSQLEGSLEGTSDATLTCVQVVGRTLSCHGTTVFEGDFEGEAATAVSWIVFRCSYVTNWCSGRSTTRESTGALAGTRSMTVLEQDLVTGAGSYTTRLIGG